MATGAAQDASLPSSDWLAEHRAELVGFATAARHPAGGFGWLGADGTLVPDRPLELWITCRMTYVFALAERHDGADTGDLVEHGLAALAGRFADPRHGGWYGAVAPDGSPTDPTKRAYDHAFVVLASAAALGAGHPAAEPLLSSALAVLDERFHDPAAGLYADVTDESFAVREPYLGANANMHLVEALLAADAVGSGTAPRALTLAEVLIDGVARDHDFRLPEHFDADGRVRLDFNRDQPAHPFRPYGVTVGHLLEWARLLVHLRHGVADPPPWLLPAAASLFERAVADGWDVDGAPGFVYTTDFDGVPVVRQRMHWVQAEALGAAHALAQETGDPSYSLWAGRWWRLARERFVDPAGSWHHELDPTLRPAATVWAGKPDVYHAYQAALLPALPLGGSLVVPA